MADKSVNHLIDEWMNGCECDLSANRRYHSAECEARFNIAGDAALAMALNNDRAHQYRYWLAEHEGYLGEGDRNAFEYPEPIGPERLREGMLTRPWAHVPAEARRGEYWRAEMGEFVLVVQPRRAEPVEHRSLCWRVFRGCDGSRVAGSEPRVGYSSLSSAQEAAERAAAVERRRSGEVEGG